MKAYGNGLMHHANGPFYNISIAKHSKALHSKELHSKELHSKA